MFSVISVFLSLIFFRLHFHFTDTNNSGQCYKNMQILAYLRRRNLPKFEFDCFVLRTSLQNLLNWSLEDPFFRGLGGRVKEKVLIIKFYYEIKLMNFEKTSCQKHMKLNTFYYDVTENWFHPKTTCRDSWAIQNGAPWFRRSRYWITPRPLRPPLFTDTK